VSPRAQRWTVRLSAIAEADFKDIVRWTSKHFGETQAVAYAETLSMAVAALSQGPTIVGVKQRDEILKGLYSLHVARQGRKGRHFILFRLEPRGSGEVIEVLRLLHDAMDLPRHFDSTQ